MHITRIPYTKDLLRQHIISEIKEACFGLIQNESSIDSLCSFTPQNSVQTILYWWFISIHIWALSFSEGFITNWKLFPQFCFLKDCNLLHKTLFHIIDIHFSITHFTHFLDRLTLFRIDLLPWLDLIYHAWAYEVVLIFLRVWYFLSLLLNHVAEGAEFVMIFRSTNGFPADLFNTDLMRLDYQLKEPSNSGCQLQLWRLINTEWICELLTRYGQWHTSLIKSCHNANSFASNYLNKLQVIVTNQCSIEQHSVEILSSLRSFYFELFSAEPSCLSKRYCGNKLFLCHYSNTGECMSKLFLLFLW